MRISHWIKNGFVAAPLLFSGKFMEPWPWIETALAVLVFGLLASAVYMINDVCDAEKDRLHPVKRNRPVASGRLSPTSAVLGGVGLALLAYALMAAEVAITTNGRRIGGSDMLLMSWASVYLAINLLYSFWLKRLAILDVLMVAMGFVVRAMAGAAAIEVPVSPWLVVCTLSLTLFIALTKRRSEVTELDASHASNVRAANREYTPALLEYMLTVATSMAIITYTLYCLAPSTIQRFHSSHMVWTIPLVIYGLFRYNMLTRQAGKNDPVKVLLKDATIWYVVGAYVAMTAILWRFGRLPGITDILG